MSRIDRAKQFAPFDALKGLQEALRLKEYEHDRILKGDVQEEQVEKISKTLLNLDKNQNYALTYFSDGYYKKLVGKMRLNIETNQVEINKLKIDLEDIFDVEIEEGN